MRTKKIALPFLFFLIISIFSSIILVTAQTPPPTNLTVTTNKQTNYDKYDPITLSGTLQYGSVSPSNALIGLEVDFPNAGGPLILRTVQTGSGTPSNLAEQINSAYPTNGQGGNQIGTVQNNAWAYFSVSVTDIDGKSYNGMVLAISLFDGNGVPLGFVSPTLSMGAGTTQTAYPEILIPSTAHSGTAYGYVDLYSTLPQNNGFPMAQELPFQFTISGGTPSSGPAPSTSSVAAGAYSLTFKLPKTPDSVFPKGAYKVYASSSYPAGQVVTAQTGFDVMLIGDFNFAQTVSGNDLLIFASAYINSHLTQSYNTLCDINGDGKVDSTDFFMFIAAYIQYWSP